ncbi:MAG: hypothetical protein SWQ30_22395 [Thermodesulfobacteriota bacterium]|nr:hypothetical protein [Thermodesulfobacteriota bacterium]
MQPVDVYSAATSDFRDSVEQQWALQMVPLWLLITSPKANRTVQREYDCHMYN